MNLINILLVEDDQLDVIDIKRTLDKMNILYKLDVAKNGRDALEMLTAEPGAALKPLPDVALVDINMPKMNGLEFIGEIRKNERLKAIKCFIVTTSDENVDRQAAAKLGVSGYIIKPLKLSNPTKDAFNLLIDLMNTKKHD
jgi:CheY-like chemotaxis protein